MPGDDRFDRASETVMASTPPSGELAALAARVAELERVVAALQSPRPEAAGALRTQAAPAPPPIASARVAAGIVEDAALPPLTPVQNQGGFAAELERRHTSLEDRLGSQIFNLVGIVAIIVGTSWALKLAIEHGLIGPVARVVLGLAVGTAAVLWSERFRHRGYAAFSYTLKAVGSGVLYLVLWAAMQIYHLLPGWATLVAMVLVTAWNAWMAWAQDAELLAGYALAGGLATPMLLSTGGDHETFLFTYVAVIDVATVLLVRYKPWRRLLVPAYMATTAYFIGWYSQFFHGFHYGTPVSFDGQAAETTLFAAVFFALFGLVSIKGWRREYDAGESVITDVLVPLGNGAFVSLALYSILQDSGLHEWLPWMLVGLAAIFLGLLRLQRTRVAAAVHLAAAVVFLTVAIPIKASGHMLTAAWLVEGLALYWVAKRVPPAADGAAKRILMGLSVGGYALGLASLLAHWWWFGGAGSGFWNANLGSALLAVATLGAAVWLAAFTAEQTSGEGAIPAAALVAIDLVALLLAFGVSGEFQSVVAFDNPRFAGAVVALAVLAMASATGYWLERRWEPQHALFEYLSAGTLVVFNLVAILAIEREIDLLFLKTATVDAGLERSLAISGFLMAYGALLLAAGFWWRSALVRWQALVLLILTILKVFLYDISGLSQGYRVVSFLALGALLLGVSFAYQKDWLGLKQSGADSPEGRA